MVVGLPENSWLSKDDCDTDRKCICQIANVKVSNENNKQTVLLDITTPYGSRRFDAYGDNLRWLISKYGPDEKQWYGKSFVLHFKDSKNKKGENTVKKVIMP